MLARRLDRTEVEGRRETADARIDTTGHQTGGVNGGTDVIQAHYVPEFMHEHRHEIDFSGCLATFKRGELPRRCSARRELFGQQWCRIDEPAITGSICVQGDRRTGRERQVAIGQIGYINGSLAQQCELFRTESCRLRVESFERIDQIPIRRYSLVAEGETMLKYTWILLALAITQAGCSIEEGGGAYTPVPLADNIRQEFERNKREFLTIEELSVGSGPLAAWGRKIEADIEVQNVDIAGRVTGNIAASEKVELKADCRVVGDVRAPRILIADGASFKGNVDMDVKER